MAPITITDIPDDVRRALAARAASHGRTEAEEVAALLTERLRPARRRSLLELDGLGKERWEGIDAAAYIDEERRSWDWSSGTRCTGPPFSRCSSGPSRSPAV